MPHAVSSGASPVGQRTHVANVDQQFAPDTTRQVLFVAEASPILPDTEIITRDEFSVGGYLSVITTLHLMEEVN